MGIKSKWKITRELAISILLDEIPNLPNDTLDELIRLIAKGADKGSFNIYINNVTKKKIRQGNNEH